MFEIVGGPNDNVGMAAQEDTAVESYLDGHNTLSGPAGDQPSFAYQFGSAGFIDAASCPAAPAAPSVVAAQRSQAATPAGRSTSAAPPAPTAKAKVKAKAKAKAKKASKGQAAQHKSRKRHVASKRHKPKQVAKHRARSHRGRLRVRVVHGHIEAVN